MQRVTFGKFLERTSTYERMPVSIDPGLRRGVWLSESLICVCLIIYQFLPSGNYIRSAPFFLWKNDLFASAWDFTADHRQLMLIICGLVFFFTLGLAVPTHSYRSAEIGLHAALFVPVAFAAVNLLFVAGLVLPVVANLVLWVCFATLALLIGVFLLGIFIQMASR